MLMSVTIKILVDYCQILQRNHPRQWEEEGGAIQVDRCSSIQALETFQMNEGSELRVHVFLRT